MRPIGITAERVAEEHEGDGDGGEHPDPHAGAMQGEQAKGGEGEEHASGRTESEHQAVLGRLVRRLGEEALSP